MLRLTPLSRPSPYLALAVVKAILHWAAMPVIGVLTAVGRLDRVGLDVFRWVVGSDLADAVLGTRPRPPGPIHRKSDLLGKVDSLPSCLSLGSHSLTFRIPNLC